MDKPEALRLADALTENHPYPLDIKQAAAELRRQHGEIKSMQAERMRTERRLLAVEAQRDALMEANEAFSKRQQWWNEKMFTLEQQRDALLEALKAVEPLLAPEVRKKARAVIKAAEETK